MSSVTYNDGTHARTHARTPCTVTDLLRLYDASVARSRSVPLLAYTIAVTVRYRSDGDSGWNIMTMLTLRLLQGNDGIYYCGNWTTPGNCHDMSLLSGMACAHAIGAKYLFEGNKEAKKDFHRLRSLMGV